MSANFESPVVTEGFVDVEGARLRYTRCGQGPAVLMIQGVGLGACGWTPQVEELSGHFSMIAFDNRGIGGSRTTSRTLTIPQLAADSLAILDALAIEGAHVIGHSMGGVIACELALTAPGRIRSLGLLCTFARGAQATAMTPALLWSGLRSRVGTRDMRRGAFLELVLPSCLLAGADRQQLARDLEPIFGHDLADQPPIAMAQLSAMRRYDRFADLGRLASVPTLVVSAELDLIARPIYGRALAGAIRGSRYVEIPNAAHGVPISRPREVNALLAAHWASVAPLRS